MPSFPLLRNNNLFLATTNATLEAWLEKEQNYFQITIKQQHLKKDDEKEWIPKSNQINVLN